MKIKYLIAASVVALTAAASANAADIIRNEPAPVVVAPVFSWTGAFVGGQIGGTWSDSSVGVNRGTVHNGYSPDASGFMGGLYAGYNYQFNNNVVLGADTDFTWADASKGFGETFADESSLDGRVKQKWAGATRVRLGYAMDRWMPYLAGGVAYTQVKSDVNLRNAAGEVTSNVGGNKTLTGYTVGGGVEYALTDNVLLRGEYRYSDFGHKGYGDDSLNSKVDYKTNDIRVGVAYKF